MKKFRFTILVAILLLTCSFKECYKQAGKGEALPSHIKTIAIPPFQNPSLRYKVEQRFTSAMIDEVLRRQRALQVVSKAEGADAVVLGTIKQFAYRGVLLDDFGRARVFEITVVAGITIKDQTKNKVLYDNQNYIFKTEYEITGDPNTFFNEEGPAVERLARDFAKSVLTMVMEGF